MRQILILLLLAAPCHAVATRPPLPGELATMNSCQRAFALSMQRSRAGHAKTMRLLRKRIALLLEIQRHQESIIRSLEVQLKSKGRCD